MNKWERRSLWPMTVPQFFNQSMLIIQLLKFWLIFQELKMKKLVMELRFFLVSTYRGWWTLGQIHLMARSIWESPIIRLEKWEMKTWRQLNVEEVDFYCSELITSTSVGTSTRISIRSFSTSRRQRRNVKEDSMRLQYAWIEWTIVKVCRSHDTTLILHG